ncbi:MAG: hypothetical protein A3H28_14975 [Acidobacteria bacterium RIFCSPLOWO2_02_FULL_61_28]|nr:MAG: hypothetical protein A3H28_14975 [Acidobacteria bacterium RIFCSPLOWO2_02_FULL_61_28]
MTDVDAIRTALPLVAPMVSALIDTWLRPKLQETIRRHKTTIKLENIVLLDSLRDYLIRTYDTHSYLTTLVLQNRPKHLLDLYIPLRLESARTGKRTAVDGYPDALVDKCPHLLIADAAGMGKSTLLKRMFLATVETNRGIPVFVSLRRLAGPGALTKAIAAILSSLTEPIDEELVYALLERGDFVLFLDGYDEIPPNVKADVVTDLLRVIERAPKNTYILSSRPEASLAGFPTFERFRICPLSRDQAHQLLRRYDDGGSVSARLISALAEPPYEKAVSEFLGNPLLVSLLFRSFEYKPRIPIRRNVFYRQVYDALYDAHDLTKGDAFIRDKTSGLGIEELHAALRRFGFDTAKEGKIEFSKDEIVPKLDSALKSLSPGVSASVGSLLADLLVRVPLLQEDGVDIRWCHKAMQDYFAAQFVYADAAELQGPILKALTRNNDVIDRFHHVLELYYEANYSGFRRDVMLPVFQQVCEAFDEAGESREVNDPEILRLWAALMIGDTVEVRRDSQGGHDWKAIPGGQLAFRVHDEPTIGLARFLRDVKHDAALSVPAGFNDILGPDWMDRVPSAVAALHLSMRHTGVNRLVISGHGAERRPPKGPRLSAILDIVAWTYVVRERGASFYEPACRHEIAVAAKEAESRATLALGL